MPYFYSLVVVSLFPVLTAALSCHRAVHERLAALRHDSGIAAAIMSGLWIAYGWALRSLRGEPLCDFVLQWIVASAVLVFLSYGHNAGGGSIFPLLRLWFTRDPDKILARAKAIGGGKPKKPRQWWVGVLVALIVYSLLFLQLVVTYRALRSAIQ
jgi:hypothetical protein